MLIDPERHLGALGLAKRDGDAYAVRAMESGDNLYETTKLLFQDACVRLDDEAACRYLRYYDAARYTHEHAERVHYAFKAWRVIKEDMPPAIDASGRLTLPMTRRLVLQAAADVLGPLQDSAEALLPWWKRMRVRPTHLLVEQYLLGHPDLQAIVLDVLKSASERIPIDVSAMIELMERRITEGLEANPLYKLLGTIAMSSQAKLRRHKLSEDFEALDTMRTLSESMRRSLQRFLREARHLDEAFRAFRLKLTRELGAEDAALSRGAARLHLSIRLPRMTALDKQAFRLAAVPFLEEARAWMAGLPGRPRLQVMLYQLNNGNSPKYRLSRTFRDENACSAERKTH